MYSLKHECVMSSCLKLLFRDGRWKTRLKLLLSSWVCTWKRCHLMCVGPRLKPRISTPVAPGAGQPSARVGGNFSDKFACSSSHLSHAIVPYVNVYRAKVVRRYRKTFGVIACVLFALNLYRTARNSPTIEREHRTTYLKRFHTFWQKPQASYIQHNINNEQQR